MANIVTIDGCPVYNAIIGDNSQGMDKISLVDYPAVMSDFVKMHRAEEAKQVLLSVQDEEKRLVYGVIMRADFPIYRKDEKLGAYYIIYKADTIRQMAEKYLADGKCNNVNLMHEDGSDVEGVQMVQYFIKDADKGINPVGFDNIADGSLFGEFHITNDEVWEKVKDGTYRGFSLEGWFDLVPETNEDEVRSIVDTLAGAFASLFRKSNTQTNMTRLERIKAAIAKALVACANCTTDKGILYWDGEDEVAVDTPVFTDEAKETPAEDGEYVREDGTTIVVAGGKVTEIKPKEDEPTEPAPAPQENSKVSTEGGDLIYAGEGELAEGTPVFTDEDMQTPAPDGEYKTADGKVIVVAEGKVTEIKDAQADPEPQENAQKLRIAEVVAKMSASFSEIEAKICEAIAGLGYHDFYLEDAGEDFAVIWVWDSMAGASKYFRFSLSVAEDGNVTIAGEGIQVKPAFVPMDYDPSATPAPATETGEEVEQLRAQVKELEEKLAKTPATISAHAAYHKLANTPAESEVKAGKDRRCVTRKTL